MSIAGLEIACPYPISNARLRIHGRIHRFSLHGQIERRQGCSQVRKAVNVTLEVYVVGLSNELVNRRETRGERVLR